MHGAYIMAEQGGNMLPLTAPKVSSNKIYYQKYLPPNIEKVKIHQKNAQKSPKVLSSKKKKKKKNSQKAVFALKTRDLH